MVWLIAAKFLSYLGLSLLLGRIVSRWVHGATWSTLPLSWPITGFGLLLLGMALGVGATLHDLGFTASADIVDYLSTTKQGKAAVASVLGGVLLLLAESNPAFWVLGPLGALLTVGGVAAAGHAAELGALWVLLDGIHALAAASWLGGLLGLFAQPARGLQAQNFSKLATVCVVLLTFSGLAAALQHLPAAAWGAALMGSNWGLMLLAKLTLVLLTLAAALVVRSRLLVPENRVSRRAARKFEEQGHQARGWLLSETALLLLVMGFSGALSSSPLPANVVAQAQTLPLSVTLQGQTLTGQLSIKGHGEVKMQLSPPVDGLSARLLMTDHPMPPQTLALSCDAAACQGSAQLWMSGNWTLELTQGSEGAKVPFRY